MITNGGHSDVLKIEIIALHGALRATGTSTTMTYSLFEIIGYAGDLALIGRDKKTLEESLEKLEQQVRVREFNINQTKTK